MRVRITLECTECHQRNYNLTKEKKTEEESLDYLRCMCISKDGREVNPNIFRALTPKQSKESF